MIPEKLRREMTKQHYKIVGNHSAVKLCMWLKKSIRDGGFCYKQKFYGIQSHRCLQMAPWIDCCNSCLYCWRIIEKMPKFSKIDEPKGIIKGCIEAQRKLISGFPGWEGTNMKKWKEANKPKMVACSLIGEPTMYPLLPGLIEEFKKQGFTAFLVTNGQLPERLEQLTGKTEPTQLYISVDAPNKQIYKKLDRPSLPDFWERLLSSLELMNSFSCRKVIRLTLVKGLNMTKAGEYAKLIEKSGCDFVEVKGFVHVGESQKRLPREAMPLHRDVQGFAAELAKETGYKYKNEQKESRVVLLSRKI
jgi:tRNA wybutosine-synthesizing protein 1